jgi:hypothetical protein
MNLSNSTSHSFYFLRQKFTRIRPSKTAARGPKWKENQEICDEAVSKKRLVCFYVVFCPTFIPSFASIHDPVAQLPLLVLEINSCLVIYGVLLLSVVVPAVYKSKDSELLYIDEIEFERETQVALSISKLSTQQEKKSVLQHFG